MASVYHIYKEGDTLDEGYIGISDNVSNRIGQHFTKLSNNKHPNYKLQEAYNQSQYSVKVLVKSTRKYCLSIEKLLRPKRNMGLNIAGGGGGNSDPISIINGVKTRIERYGYAFGTLESRDKMYNKINGTHPFLKRNRKGIIGNEFTSESSSKLAKYRSKMGTLPAQISSKNGTHHWFKSSHSERISKKNSELFTDTVTVTDKNGISKRITKEQFMSQQIGNREMWEYVGVASKEAKIRKGGNL